jgi:hypothetical protein
MNMRLLYINMKKTMITLNSILPALALVSTVAINDVKDSFFAHFNSENNGISVEHKLEFKEINREAVLNKFFEKYNSPLKGSARTFVKVADKYQIDYKILPSIACMESTCGKFLIEGSYNPFGWGVYGNQYIAFDSYEDAIETVGKGLNEGYFAKGLDKLELIAPVYTPPNHVNWLSGVRYFSNEIAYFETNNTYIH